MADFSAYSGTLSSLNFVTNSTGSLNGGPSPLATSWLSSVQRTVFDSVGSASQVSADQERWLTAEAANTAVRFFQLAADALPGAPVLYKSSVGDLVAEFRGKHGVLTSVVSGNTLMLYPVIDGKLQSENRFDLQNVTASVLQAALRPITDVLNTGDHGPALGP